MDLIVDVDQGLFFLSLISAMLSAIAFCYTTYINRKNRFEEKRNIPAVSILADDCDDIKTRLSKEGTVLFVNEKDLLSLYKKSCLYFCVTLQHGICYDVFTQFILDNDKINILRKNHNSKNVSIGTISEEKIKVLVVPLEFGKHFQLRIDYETEYYEKLSYVVTGTISHDCGEIVYRKDFLYSRKWCLFNKEKYNFKLLKKRNYDLSISYTAEELKTKLEKIKEKENKQ